MYVWLAKSTFKTASQISDFVFYAVHAEMLCKPLFWTQKSHKGYFQKNSKLTFVRSVYFNYTKRK